MKLAQFNNVIDLDRLLLPRQQKFRKFNSKISYSAAQKRDKARNFHQTLVYRGQAI